MAFEDSYKLYAQITLFNRNHIREHISLECDLERFSFEFKKDLFSKSAHFASV